MLLVMHTGAEQGALEAVAAPALAFDPAADEVVGEHRDERAGALGRGDRLALWVVGGGFVATALCLNALVPVTRHPGLAVPALPAR